MDSLRYHRDYLEGEWQRLCLAPLSARKARLVAALIDAYVDRLFATRPEAEDILAFRAEMATRSAALGRIMAFCGQTDGRVAAEAVEVPIAEYGALSVEDFMVSLYNDHAVQRLVLMLADGSRHDMVDTVRQAIGALD